MYYSIDTPRIHQSHNENRKKVNNSKSATADHSIPSMSFPSKLYALLEDAERCGFDDVISWQATGTSFKIHKPQVFAETFLKKYFSQSRLKSLQRQLNIYNFRKVAMGPQKGGYQHKYFVRGKPELCVNIVRQRTCRDSAQQAWPDAVKPIHLEDAEISTLYDFFYPQDPETRQFVQNILSDDDSTETCLDANRPSSRRDDIDVLDLDVLQFDTVELEDFSSALIDPDAAVEPVAVESRDPEEEETSDLSFPYKVHMMVENAEKDNYSHIVSWTKDGKAFQVHNVDEFVKSVLPLFFDQSKYESFRRQLNMYMFKRVARGELRGTISHPSFVRGARWMCKDIKRVRFQHR